MPSTTMAQLVVELDQMKLRETRYRVLLDDSSDPIFNFNEDGQCLYVNQAFADGIDGTFTPDDIIGKTILGLFPKEGANYRFEVLNNIFESGEPINIEVIVPKADGDTYYLATVKLIIGRNNEVY